MARRVAPASFEALVAEYDHFITVLIYRISKRAVRPEDVPDLKQQIYTRLLETGYLERYQPDRGSFSTYLFPVIRSVIVNQFEKNSRNPLNAAKGLDERRPKSDRDAKRLAMETLKDFWDEDWEERQLWKDVLDRFERFTTTTKDGAELARVLRLLYEGRTPGEIATTLGLRPTQVAKARKRLRELVETYREAV